jgi:hypothetical protein
MQIEELKTILNNRLRTGRDLYVQIRETGNIEDITRLEIEIAQTERTLAQLETL